MQIVFLGTSGWYPTTSNTTCTLINASNCHVILDAGDGFYKIGKYIKDAKPIYIFLSHFHLDHVIGFHTLSMFHFKQKIEIYGGAGMIQGLSTILDHPFSTPLSSLPLKVSMHEIEEGDHDVPFKFSCKALLHSDITLGYRLELDGKLIAYCTDTGKSDNINVLASNADLLISECSYKPGQERWGWPHLKPVEIAQIAKESKVKRLVLTHFDASIFPTTKHREGAVETARGIFPASIAAYDDAELGI